MKATLFDARAPRRGLVLLAMTCIALSWTDAAFAIDSRGALPVNASVGQYVGYDAYLPMRDGKRLHAEVWRPKKSSAPLPFLIQRSPYGFNYNKVRESFEAQFKELGEEKFIFVLEDIRGRFGSGGEFVMLRPPAPEQGGVDESSDTYDTIAWLLTNVPGNNGRVGIFGVSYLGWTTAMATINPHPALKAVSVQASPEDMFLGDDFYHNGAFRLSYSWEYAVALEADGRTLNPYNFHDEDPYQWYLEQFHLADLDRREFGRDLPSWQNFARHPSYDSFWQSAVTSALMPKSVAIPDLIVAGWWDQEDMYGPLQIYKRQKTRDSGMLNHLVIGPWNHGGWTRSGSDHYGPFDLGSDTGSYFRANIETPWFRYWLKREGTLATANAVVFETGSNQWHEYASWPPTSEIHHENLYFHSNGLLSFAPPAPSEVATNTSFLSDPANPVPYRPGVIPSTMVADTSWRVWLADDQSTFAARPDVVTWSTTPLEKEVIVRGDVIAKLFASTTGTDADWVVKLIDVYPGDDTTPKAVRGRQLLIGEEVFRGRFRKSFEHPQAITANAVLDYAIDLHSVSHVFRPGHRISVQVQSSWFPLIDRNPQTYQASIFEATKQNYQAQMHTVYHNLKYPSGIAIDVPSSRVAAH